MCKDSNDDGVALVRDIDRPHPVMITLLQTSASFRAYHAVNAMRMMVGLIATRLITIVTLFIALHTEVSPTLVFVSCTVLLTMLWIISPLFAVSYRYHAKTQHAWATIHADIVNSLPYGNFTATRNRLMDEFLNLFAQN